MPKCETCSDSFKTQVKIDGRWRNLCNRKRCLKCQPFGQKKGSWFVPKPKIPFNQLPSCELCGKERSRKGTLCSSCVTKVRRYRCRLAAIKLLGGKCVRCGWNGPVVGYDFHHKSNKEFAISMIAQKSWDVVKKELVKCELLCALCHRIEHSALGDEKFLERVAQYEGRLLV